MHHKAFTFIEFLIVIAIISILAVMLFPAIQMIRSDTRTRTEFVGKEVRIKSTDSHGTILKVTRTKPTVYLVRIYRGKDAPKAYEEVEFFESEIERLPE